MLYKKNGLANSAWFLIGLGSGILGSYLLDPGRGARRRALIRDKAVRAGNYVADRADKRARDLLNRAKGAVAEAQASLRSEEISDDVLIERVRAQLGHVVSHPGSLEIKIENGRLVVSGPVLRGERDKIQERLEETRGVKDYGLEVIEHPDSSNIPELQGESRFQHKHKIG